MSSFEDLLKLVSDEKQKKKLLAETNLSDFLTLVETSKPKKTQDQLVKEEIKAEIAEEKVEPVLITKEETENVLSNIFGEIKKEKEFQAKLKGATFDDFFGIVEKVYGPPKPEINPDVQPIELERKQKDSEEFIENPNLLPVQETEEETVPIEEVFIVNEIQEKENKEVLPLVEYAEKGYVESLIEDLAKRDDFESLQKEITILKKLYEDFKKTIIKDISKMGKKTSSGALYNSSGGGAVNLRDLDDVNANNLIDGYVLTYNQTVKKFVFAPPSGGSGGQQTITKIAAEPILENTAIMVSGDLTYTASSLDVNSVGFVAGLAGNSANVGDLVEVKYNVEVNNPDWNFSLNAKNAFLGLNGEVQETVDTNALVVQVIGKILAPTKVYVENGFAALRTL